MPNSLGTSGLITKAKAEIVEDLTTALKAVYGDDINVSSDSPDGQMINIYAQAAVDNLDLLTQIYNSFNPDNAIGRTLDERCAINGVQRLGGTYSVTNITVVTDRALTLAGLDGDVDEADGVGYTVADNAGNQWILMATEVIASAGTYVLAFRAKNSGAVETTPNTITVPITIVLGVTSVNNPTTYTTLGIDEETDAQLRIRRQRSVALSSKGYLSSLLAALLNINGVTSAFVYENTTGSTDGDGVPSHSIWVIVQGGDDADIADAIYSKRSAGCGMKGDEEVEVIQPDETGFIVKFDRTVSENLYIQAHIGAIDASIGTPDLAAIKSYLVTNLAPGVNSGVNINQLATLIQEFDSNAYVVPTSGDGFSLTAGSYADKLSPSAKNKQFAVASARMAFTAV